MKPVIGITMGDPTGVGPELLLRVMSNRDLIKRNSFVVFGDFSYLARVHRYYRKKRFCFDFYQIPSNQSVIPDLRLLNLSRIPVIDDQLLENIPVQFGRVEKWAGYASGVFIKQAIKAVLKKEIDAIVTLPINKESFNRGGWGKHFTDHTQMMAKITKTQSVALMLVSGNMRAVHVTQHIPLKDVPSLITKNRVSQTIELTIQGLQKMGIHHPKVAVCGLNPHAGDGGILGREEIAVIQPVIRSFKRRKLHVEGPFSADTVWPSVSSGKFDAGVAMYHDQGQIPIKLFGNKVVNVTLGLPFVRTSVGHGTAFNLAGTGQASEESFIYAIETALKMLRSSRRVHVPN